MLPSQKVVVCGAGFLGSNIARIMARDVTYENRKRLIQVSSRRPEKAYLELKTTIPKDQLLPPFPLDITKPETLIPAFEGAEVVVSLVGLMHGTPQTFEDIQWKGAENVAKATRHIGAKLIHISAIGADPQSVIPYSRTKGLAEIAVRRICPDVTILRPSIIFGPQDDFFNRFSRLSQILPFIPVYGGGRSRFQPVYVEDVARAVEIISRNTPQINDMVSGKYIEAGGPEVFTYREMMQLVLKYKHRYRPILSLPFSVGILQGLILEKFPHNIFTVSRAQVEQLKFDNLVNPLPAADSLSFKGLLEQNSGPLTSVHDILPTYL